MKSPYIRDLKPNQVVTTTFLVHIKDIRQKKSGEPYLSLLLGDRTGEVDAKMWDNVAEVMDTFDRDDFVKIKGLLQIFQNRPQLTIHKMSRVLDSDIDFGDYFPVSERDPMEMFAELRGIVSGIENVHLRALLNAFLDDEPLARMYRTAPAAKHVHHAWLGGLIEHALSVCHLCRMTAAHYRYVDLDLLLAGAILHDVGKVAELSYDRSFGYSTEGQLLGHIVIGLRFLYEKLQRFPDFPPKLRTLLEHMIVSHHGELEFGSPKVPLFPEALLLHQLDNLDSKMECMHKLVSSDRHVEGFWTGYSSSLDRTVLKTSKYLREEPAEEILEAAAEPARAPQAALPEALPNVTASAAPSPIPRTAPAPQSSPTGIPYTAAASPAAPHPIPQPAPAPPLAPSGIPDTAAVRPPAPSAIPDDAPAPPFAPVATQHSAPRLAPTAIPHTSEAPLPAPSTIPQAAPALPSASSAIHSAAVPPPAPTAIPHTAAAPPPASSAIPQATTAPSSAPRPTPQPGPSPFTGTRNAPPPRESAFAEKLRQAWHKDS